MSRLILASRSPARSRLLADAGIDFSVDAADVDETQLKAAQPGAAPRRIAADLAAAKALHVARRSDGLVIGADQTLDLDGRLFDKPTSLTEARTQLLALRGRSHQLHAAVTVAQAHEVLWEAVETVTLTVRPFSDAFLEAYLAQEGVHLLGCVGAYRLEALGGQLFDAVEGDYFTVLGLPLLPLLAFLRRCGALAS